MTLRVAELAVGQGFSDMSDRRRVSSASSASWTNCSSMTLSSSRSACRRPATSLRRRSTSTLRTIRDHRPTRLGALPWSTPADGSSRVRGLPSGQDRLRMTDAWSISDG